MVELKVNHFIFCISYNFVQGYSLMVNEVKSKLGGPESKKTTQRTESGRSNRLKEDGLEMSESARFKERKLDGLRM